MTATMIAVSLIAACPGATTVWGAEPPVTALTFSADGTAIVSASQAGIEVRRLDDLSGDPRRRESLEQIHDVIFSPDGSRLAVVGGIPGELGQLELFDWPSLQQAATVEVGEDVLYSAGWSNDRAHLIVAGFDGTVRLIDAQAGRVDQEFAGHSRGVTAVATVPLTGTADEPLRLVTGSIDQTLRVWSLNTGRTIRTLHNHTAAVHAIAVRPSPGDGSLPVIATAADDRTVRFWQPTIGRMMRFARLEQTATCLAWSPEGTQVIAGCTDGHLRTIALNTAAIIDDRPALATRVTSLAVHPETGAVAVGGPNLELRLISTKPTDR